MTTNHCPLRNSLKLCAKIFRERAMAMEQIANDYEQRVLKPMKNMAESRAALDMGKTRDSA